MKNRIASIALTVVMILGCVITNIDFNVNTVCADPYNIEISVETKEISIEEIPEDRMVAVEVYASNVPDEDFFSLNIAYKLDSKIEKWFDLSWGENAVSSLSVQTRIENKYLFLESDTFFQSNKKIDNGRIYDISIFIPTEVNEGDFYEIIPVSDCNNGYDYTSFAFESNRKELYGPSNFSFISGGIKIHSSQTELQISNEPIISLDNDAPKSQSEMPDNRTHINNDITEGTVSSAILTISSTNPTTSHSLITSKELTGTETHVNTNTESLNSSEITERNSSNSNFIILILVLLCLLIIVIVLTIIFKNKKNNSIDNQH